jgi:pimeloyl-ACP methyl ester carboxylesterase
MSYPLIRASSRANRTTTDGAIAYEIVGGTAGSPTLALLPGWMITNRGMWSPLLTRLPPDLRTVRYDSRGTGASNRPTSPQAYGLTHLVADAIGVLDASDTARAIVVGSSLGGLLGVLLAAQRPERVAGLVLIGASVDLAGGEPSPLQRALATFDDRLDGPKEGWARYHRHAWRDDYPGFVEWFVRTALGAGAPAEAVAEGRHQGLDVDPETLAATVAGRGDSDPALLRRVVAGIGCPTLVMTGEHDAICPPQWSAVLAEALHTRPVIVPGAGHCPHVTHPDLVAEQMQRFVAEVTS